MTNTCAPPVEAIVRWREKHIIDERRDVVMHLVFTAKLLRERGEDAAAREWEQVAREIVMVVYRRRPFTDGSRDRIESLLPSDAQPVINEGA